MEGINNIENLADWRDKKNKAPGEALALKKQIDNYDTLSPAEKISELNPILEALKNDNANRFVYKVLDHELAELIELSRHLDKMTKLKQAA